MNGIKPTGLLSPKSAKRFLDLVVQNTPLFKHITFAPVSLPVGTYPTVGMARYKTRGYGTTVLAGRQDVATLNNLSQNDVSYSLKELVLAVVIQDSYIEDMEASHEQVAELVAKIFAKDLHHLLINGNTQLVPAVANTPTDEESLLLTLDGGIVQLDAGTTPVAYTSAASTILKKLNVLVKGTPDDILALPDTKIYINPGDYTDLWDDVMTNSKVLAVRDGKIHYRKFPVEEITGAPDGRPIIGDLSNFLGFIGRDVQLEAQRYPEARGIKVVLSTRVDIKGHPAPNIRILAASATGGTQE